MAERNPKDIEIEGTVRVIQDKKLSFGPHKGKYFSEVCETDFDYCLSLFDNAKNLRDFVSYIKECDQMVQYEEQEVLKEEEAAAKEKAEKERAKQEKQKEPKPKKSKKTDDKDNERQKKLDMLKK